MQVFTCYLIPFTTELLQVELKTNNYVLDRRCNCYLSQSTYRRFRAVNLAILSLLRLLNKENKETSHCGKRGKKTHCLVWTYVLGKILISLPNMQYNASTSFHRQSKGSKSQRAICTCYVHVTAQMLKLNLFTWPKRIFVFDVNYCYVQICFYKKNPPLVALLCFKVKCHNLTHWLLQWKECKINSLAATLAALLS